MKTRIFIEDGLHQLGITFTPKQVNQLETYVEQLIKWNKVYNLTAITEPKNIIVQHIFDSLSINQEILCGKYILDVGTGAGFPGMALAIFNPNKIFYLVDGVSKKTTFLRDLQGRLGLKNINIYHAKVENLHLDHEMDLIVSRAFAEIKKMIELTKHLLKKTGSFLAMKGPSYEKELLNIELNRISVIPLNIPMYDGVRNLIKINK